MSCFQQMNERNLRQIRGCTQNDSKVRVKSKGGRNGRIPGCLTLSDSSHPASPREFIYFVNSILHCMNGSSLTHLKFTTSRGKSSWYPAPPVSCSLESSVPFQNQKTKSM